MGCNIVAVITFAVITQVKSEFFNLIDQKFKNVFKTLMGFQLPASKANLNDICPSHVAHALSIANTMGSITGFLSPAIAGELLDTYGNNHTSWGIIWSISGKKPSFRYFDHF